MDAKGVIFIAAGSDYTRAANEAARSVRRHAPSLLIDLFTDTGDCAERIFDEVHRIESPHLRSKVDYIHKTRFSRTLYLDTDILVDADITEMFDVLERFDIAIAHAHTRNREATRTIWRKKVPDAFPQMNGGVILYRSTPPVLEFLRDWQQAYHEAGFKKDQVTLRELLWESDLRIHILPPEYNVRYEKYLSIWDEKEAVPRILHFARFHAGHKAAIESQGARRTPAALVSRLHHWVNRRIDGFRASYFHSKCRKS
jgi:hypothetical protein